MRSFIGTWVLAFAMPANAYGGPLAGAEVSASATVAAGLELGLPAIAGPRPHTSRTASRWTLQPPSS